MINPDQDILLEHVGHVDHVEHIGHVEEHVGADNDFSTEHALAFIGHVENSVEIVGERGEVAVEHEGEEEEEEEERQRQEDDRIYKLKYREAKKQFFKAVEKHEHLKSELETCQQLLLTVEEDKYFLLERMLLYEKAPDSPAPAPVPSDNSDSDTEMAGGGGGGAGGGGGGGGSVKKPRYAYTSGGVTIASAFAKHRSLVAGNRKSRKSNAAAAALAAAAASTDAAGTSAAGGSGGGGGSGVGSKMYEEMFNSSSVSLSGYDEDSSSYQQPPTNLFTSSYLPVQQSQPPANLLASSYLPIQQSHPPANLLTSSYLPVQQSQPPANLLASSYLPVQQSHPPANLLASSYLSSGVVYNHHDEDSD